jgi:hypothetical protein
MIDHHGNINVFTGGRLGFKVLFGSTHFNNGVISGRFLNATSVQ